MWMKATGISMVEEVKNYDNQLGLVAISRCIALLLFNLIVLLGLLRNEITWHDKLTPTPKFHKLDQLQWRFRSENNSISGRALVPGDIYADLLANKIIVEEPLYDDNDQALRWVPRINWIYETTFTLPDTIDKSKHSVVLNAQGLDTIADVYVNDKLLIEVKNQFIPVQIEIKNWHHGINELRIFFHSPIDYTEEQAKLYKKNYQHGVPPECPVREFRGECHANFVRKIQASFSWDWGPSFPTVGIWQPIAIEVFDTIIVRRPSTTIHSEEDGFIVSALVPVFSRIASSNVKVTLKINELSMSASFNAQLLTGQLNHLNTTFRIANKKVERWWPNGLGEQKLYELQTVVTIQEKDYYGPSIKIGFRTVELIEDFVDETNPSLGRNFYIKINDVPVFLKGSNWIPISAFPARDHQKRLNFLLESTKQANMNALRVWGGGRYESEEFYDLVDQMGIMIWQDMMFACALYPVDEHFLTNVREEITTQIEDYVKLYRDVIGPVIKDIDPTRPYILSSPTNGVETLREGGVATNPQSDIYGDIHFYNEFSNLWRDGTYDITRCASEYGVQSFPRKETMLKWLSASEWYYTSKKLQNRQHHPGGILAQLTMIFSHFRIPDQCSEYGESRLNSCDYAKKSSFMDRFVYYSQFHQAIAYQVQTEHYRRWRGRLHKNGKGNTMCALYWQLNDIWAAPTWSSIDFELSWKPVHYYARRFFDEIILSLYTKNGGGLAIYVVSDSAIEMSSCTISIELFSLSDGFTPIHSYHISMDIPPLRSTEVPLDERTIADLVEQNSRGSPEKQYLIRGRLFSSNGIQLGYDSVIIPDGWLKMKEHNFGTVKITAIERLDDLAYRIDLSADKLAPLIWLELRPQLLGWFSDNAFTMTTATESIQLELTEPPPGGIVTESDLSVCSLRDCGIKPNTFISSIRRE